MLLACHDIEKWQQVDIEINRMEAKDEKGEENGKKKDGEMISQLSSVRHEQDQQKTGVLGNILLCGRLRKPCSYDFTFLNTFKTWPFFLYEIPH